MLVDSRPGVSDILLSDTYRHSSGPEPAKGSNLALCDCFYLHFYTLFHNFFNGEQILDFGLVQPSKNVPGLLTSMNQLLSGS